MIGTIEVFPQAHSPDFPLDTLKSFVNSPSSIRVRNVPRKVGNWCITNVFATIAYPDNTVKTVECVLTGGVYVATFDGCSVSGKVENGLTISANGKDENDNVVTGYVLGKGDVDIMDARDNVNPSKTVYYIHLLEDEPDVPMDGDMYKKDGNYVVYQNGVENQLGISQEDVESYVDQKVEEAVEEVEGKIPTKTSDIENDSGFTTQTYVDEKVGEAVEEVEGEIPTKTSELTNDSNFITSAQVEPCTNYGMNGYAKNSEYATRLKALDMGTSMPTDRGVILPTLNYNSATNTYTLELYGSVGGYYPWYLRRLFGTDFSPVITLEWLKGTIFRKRVIGGTVRWLVTYNNWMWLAKGQYAITCPTGDGKPDGNFYVLNYEDATHPNYINDPATDVHTITYSNYDITSIDGQAGGQTSQTIWCTRTNANPITIWERPFAYRNELPTKTSDLTNDAGYLTTVSWNEVQDKPSIPTKTSDLTNDSGFLTSVSWNDIQNKPDIPSKTSDLVNDSGFITSSDIPAIPTKTSDLTNDSDFTTNTALNTGLALKQDKLSDAQVSAIDSVVDERKTYFTFPNNDVLSAYVEGTLNTRYLWYLNPELTYGKIQTATEVKIGTAVTGIGYAAFDGCSNLVKVTIPDSVVTIEEQAFKSCYALVRLEIPDGVSTINNLYGYTDVRADIVFGTGLQSISQGMFHYVSPNSVTFKGKTLAEVQAMADYPWDIEDTSIIKTFNVASKEWVEERLAQLLSN